MCYDVCAGVCTAIDLITVYNEIKVLFVSKFITLLLELLPHRHVSPYVLVTGYFLLL